ncbi:MAG: hypothetical protein ACYCZR_03740 [Burkholderiales bacterium]
MKNHDYIAQLDGPQSRIEGRRRILHKGGGGGTTTTTQEIPIELKPLANMYVDQATNYANTPFQSYTDQRFADLNQNQNAGIGMVQDRALNGSQTFDNAESNLNQMMQGGTNPYLDAMVTKAQGSVMSNAGTAMNRSGSFGNSGIQEQALNQMGDIANNMYGQQYQFDQGQRMQAVGMAPQFANQPYQDASQLLNAGNIQQQQVQQGLDFGYDQFQQQQDHPLKQMQATSGVINSTKGTSSTQSGGGK